MAESPSSAVLLNESVIPNDPQLPAPRPAPAVTEWKESAKDLFAGTMAGMVSKVIEYPFDTIKVRQQTQPGLGPLQSLSDILKKHGLSGLYRGLSAPLFGAMAENAIIFLTYAKAKRMMERAQGDQQTPILNSTVAGFCSGIGVSFWLTPVELVKVRLQAEATQHLYKGPLSCIVRTYREEGAHAFFRGHSTTLFRETFGGAAYFGVYETFVRALMGSGDRKDVAPWKLAVAGACGGAAYWLTIFPADTIKSRIQAMQSPHGRTSVLQVMRQMRAAEGLRGFYAGLSITLCRALPSNACILGTYELVMRALHDF